MNPPFSGEKLSYFDHGIEGNMKRYGTPYAAEYNLSNVLVPTYLVTGDKDPFAPPTVNISSI